MKIKAGFTLFILAFIFCTTLTAEVLRKEGAGWLEQKEGGLVLHLKGSPYEIGYQHGKLLQDLIKTNIAKFIDSPSKEMASRGKEFKEKLPTLLTFVPKKYLEEMQGLAEGSGVPFQKILTLNLFPEMFHCSGVVVSGEATKDGSLYHARVLDYAIGKSLQSSAALMVVEPEIGIPFLNASYAGFIGSVTGMNAEKIALGEIGGWGYGYWDGVPMAFLMREILEGAKSVKEAKRILSESLRTCEYYYVISDGKTNESVGVYATASQIQYIEPGSSYALIAPQNLPQNYGTNGDHDKFFISPATTEITPYQILIQDKERVAALFHKQPKECLLITGFPHPERYPLLASRVEENFGKIDAQALMQIIKKPVARPSNLHNAIFHPADLKIWISHAGANDEPACCQNYVYYSLKELLTENK